MLLANVARRVIRRGTLTLIDPDGQAHRIEGGQAGPSATARLHDRRTLHRIGLNPQLAVGEAFMDGTLTVEDGDVRDLLRLLMMNAPHQADHWVLKIPKAIDRLKRALFLSNSAGRSRANVAHHYDLSSELYGRFLDADRFYSCAYFPVGETDLDAAQHRKARHIAAKLRLEPGARVLDIGSGWGSLAIHLARHGAERVDGVTLSTEQLEYARNWIRREGLQDRIGFELRDYRALDQSYDRIVSVGMFEHVGPRHYPSYFNKINELLAEDGVALVHSIGRSNHHSPGRNAWIDRYIFPGGYIPALSEVFPAVEESGLFCTDVEILRLHYAETLKAWRDRFMARRAEIAEIYDERFCRMWDFYLSSCEMAFREGGLMVFQMQLARRNDTLPLTRDYMLDAERAAEPKARPARAGAA